MTSLNSFGRAVQNFETTSRALDVSPANQQTSLTIHTGADVVDFYRQAGRSSSVHFFKCNRAPCATRYRPYDLIVADDQNLNQQDYFHISESGVTHILAECWSEHVPLDLWDRERKQFDYLCQSVFFRNFIIRRSFHRWRKAIRRLKFERLKCRIAERAFYAKPEFLKGLQNIAEAAIKLTAVPLITFPVLGKQYETDRWADLQISSREQHVKPAVDAILDSARQDVEGICRMVGRRARDWAQSVRSTAELADHTGIDVLRGHHRPMVAIKAEKQERARRFKQVMDEARLLGNFVRLVDIMLTETLCSHVIATVKHLLQLLEASDIGLEEKPTGTFITTVSFANEGGIRCSPDDFSVADMTMTNAVEGAIALVTACPRLLWTRSFVPFYDAQPNGINLSKSIRETLMYKEACKNIEGVITRDFTKARQQAASFADYRTIFDFCSNINEQLTVIRTRLGVQEALQQLIGWHSGLSNVSDGSGVGCFYVDIKPLKLLVLPAISKAIDAVKAHAVVLAHSLCMEILLDIRASTSRLSNRPAEVESISAFQVMCITQREQSVAVLSQAAEVDELYNLLTLHEQRASTGDQVKHDDLKEARVTFQKALEDAEAYLMQKKAIRSKE